MEEAQVEVVVKSSPCSVTCGLGVKTEVLCPLKDVKIAPGGKIYGESRKLKVSDECRVRKVKCLQPWQCGLTTVTAISGDRLEIDCLGEIMEAMGKYSWR
ncbi:hypothetical protein LDENG_00198620 [Lucifuga dentata]|nr:hypothetical protein LDENG_00198620 [Lucifuga dentata]